MHTMWKGSISFGLVNIPIKLHTATEDKDVKLRTLHKACHAPIKYEKVCSACEKEVESEEIVKAYEYTKGKYVVLDVEDLEKLKKENEDKAVEIIDFVNMNEIDPIYFDRSYFMSPNDTGGKAYSLLRKALEETNKVGLARIVIRSKEQMAVIRVYQNILIMETIHYPDEVRSAEDVPNVPSEDKVTKNELETAMLLIDQLSTTFDPSKYTDEYRNALLELIEEKRKLGTETATKGTKEMPSNVTDLMAALQASIDRTKPSNTTTTTAKKKAPRPKAPVKAKKQA
ncbi:MULTISPECIES: Ku protein [unclassified Bacillus (in: firmicutes)]|uniref:non-homologous end joining protein Ku n=1 Tax=unclassified Bacillus (in: firmicutes) TaxID=185979 RepID=UPI0008EE1F85|nr:MULTISPECIES: Ku protein [unclassified Bacillus (in: firmicutes)]SFA91784.1 DNA end-binding protein Ku [Bacillus sp. UNCCL13]SFQ85662.1 DNA end-binding protein Ku [Bacillus sp. cl95]